MFLDAGLVAIQGANDRVRCKGPAIRLNLQDALALTLALHELATNATKYVALSNDTGTVPIQWQVMEKDGEPRFALSWQK